MRKMQIRLEPDDVQLIADTLERYAASDTLFPDRERTISLARYLGWRVVMFTDPGHIDLRSARPAS